MSAIKPLYHWAAINVATLTEDENLLLEAMLFARVCKELGEIFKKTYAEYFQLIQFTLEMENAMIESKLMQFIINDILSTQEYDLKGIAYYTESFEEVIEEIMAGLNVMPSAIFLRRLIELHRLVRKDLYEMIFHKIRMHDLFLGA